MWLVLATPDITTEELRQEPDAKGLAFGYGAIHRFFTRHGLTWKKKTGHAIKQDRPDILKRRWAWFGEQPNLDPERLVFIDETWAKTNMVSTHGRARRDERLCRGIPFGHWKATTFVAGLTQRGMIAPLVLPDPINRIAFET